MALQKPRELWQSLGNGDFSGRGLGIVEGPVLVSLADGPAILRASCHGRASGMRLSCHGKRRGVGEASQADELVLNAAVKLDSCPFGSKICPLP